MTMVARPLLISLCFTFFHLSISFAQQNPSFTDFINQQHDWVDSVFHKLNKKERIAQLFMVRAHTNLGEEYIDSVAKVIRKEKLGGVVLFQGGPVRHAELINRYQALAKVPLFMALDGEWGLGMRLADSTVSFPYQMTLGAIRDEQILYEMGQEVAKQFKRLGLNINFAPDVDVNNNPNNPVINFRSFGENKENVARKGAAYMKGMVDGGILTTLKHFPGHGDTDVDSHKDLPQLNFTRDRLENLEMYPFKQLIAEGAPGVMVAHMNIPALDTTAHLPSSLSRAIITDILKKQLGFRGLIFTDAMGMNGVVKYFKDGEADVRAIIAGNDVLELSQNSKRAIKKVRKAVRKKRVDREELDQRVKKVLAAKYWLQLDRWQPVPTDGLIADLNNEAALALNQRLADAAVTLLKGNDRVKALDPSKKTAIVSIGVSGITPFQQELQAYFKHSLAFVLSANASVSEIAQVSKELASYDQVIVALHDSRLRPQSKLNYNQDVHLFVSELAAKQALFTVLANPYTMATFPGIEQAGAILVGYQNDVNLQKAAAKVWTKSLVPSGKLPVTVNTFFKFGDGL